LIATYLDKTGRPRERVIHRASRAARHIHKAVQTFPLRLEELLQVLSDSPDPR
jgi:hypothetical protein